MCVTIEDIRSAHQLIQNHIKKTPLIELPEELCKKIHHSGRIFLKCENLQLTNTFKVRGAFNAILNLTEEEKKAGVVTRSSGNFAQAVSYAAQQLNIRAKIIVPDNIPQIKLSLTQQYGAEILVSGPLHGEGDEMVQKIVQEEGMTMLHPYNQKNVIAGQGTIVLEIEEQLPSLKNFFCPIGGGGLLAGCSTALKALHPDVQVIGVEPTGAADYYNSRQAGKRIPLSTVDTIADGLRASVVGELDWPLLQANVDRVDLVSDDEIKKAMQYLKNELNMITEPSGATAFASLLLHQQELIEGDVVIVVSGANIDPMVFTTEYMVK